MSVSRPSSRASSQAQDPEPSVALGAGAGDFGQDWTDDEDDVELDALLARAKLSAAKRATMKTQQKRKTSPGDGDGDGDAEDAERDAELDAVLSEEDATQDQKPPPLYIGWGLTMRDLIDSTAQAGDDELRVAAPAPPEPAFELDAEGRRVTKRDKKVRKSATAGPGWFGLPAPPAAELPRLLREAEAARRRNQLDPKRFYRKEEGLPKYFAIGQVVSTPSPFGAAPKDTLPRTARKRSVVEELVDDPEARRYAKRTFAEFAAGRCAT